MFNLDTLKEKFGMFPVMLFLAILVFAVIVGIYYLVSLFTSNELIKYFSCVGVFAGIMYYYVKRLVQ